MVKASDIFIQEEIQYIKYVMKLFNGKVVEIVEGVENKGFTKFKK